jgi:hypothetical protein
VIQGDADTDLAAYPDDAFDYVILSQTMFGVSYQGSGRVSVTGIRPRSISSLRTRQWPKFGSR